MFVKHDEIDLNADAVSGDRENEDNIPVSGDSVAVTLTERDNSQVQGSEVDKHRVYDSAKVICDLNIGGNEDNMDGYENDDNINSVENDVNMNSIGVERELDLMDKVGNVEKASESLDRGVEANDKQNNDACGDAVSKCDENEVEGTPVAERASDGAEIDRNMNVGPVGEVLEYGMNDRDEFQSFDQKFEEANCDQMENQAAGIGHQPQSEALEQGTDDRDTVQSSHYKFEEATSDGLENQAMEIDTQSQPEAMEQETEDRGNVHSLHQKLEEAISDGLENQAMKVDMKTQPMANENQFVDVHLSEVGSSTVVKESYAVNLFVDLDSCTTKNGNLSGDVNEKSVTSQPEFCEDDLVWGKVRSHPWWPGQIFGPSAASQKAKKYFKKDSYLIAYFGDQTFAWNEASKLKPFREHFAQMEKQTSLEDFHYAVDCALEEVSRRVEFGQACFCIHQESYEMIKTQITVNAGIRKESSRRDGGDRFSTAASFEPVKLSEYIKALSLLPFNIEVDRLEIVTLKAQLSAFYRWKGYLQLPEFNMLGGLIESDAEIPLFGELKRGAEGKSAVPDSNGDKQVSSETGKLKSQDGFSHKRKCINGDSIHPRKKEKSLLDLLAERRANMSHGKCGTDGKGDELISSPSGKKRKSVDSVSDDRAVKHKKLDSISDDTHVKHKKSGMLAVKHEKGDNLSVGSANKCLPVKRTFGVGNSIVKVASQLNGSSPIFKSGDGTIQKTAVKNKSKEKSLNRKQFASEEILPADLLSQLGLTARDPLEGYDFLILLVSFFSDFRNSVSLVSGEKTAKMWTDPDTTEASESEPMKDSFWTDREKQQPLENQNRIGEVLHEARSEREIPPVESTSAVQLSTQLSSGLQTAGENLEQKAVKPMDPLDGSSSDDLSPTALILNFTNLDSVPSKENLNKIFSCYGSLNELETEVSKSKRAKVVFKRRADAETAFSSAGKYSIFGPSLVSYCLKYMPSTPSKSSSLPTKRGRKAATSDVENET